MSLFGNMKNDGLEESQDRLGGFQPLESDIYTGPIKVAYAGKSAQGAQNITMIFDLNGKEYRETIYFTNKKGENWFLNKDDKSKKVPLPGFTTIDDICLVTTEKPLCDQETEDKIVKVYDPDSKKEVNKSVPVLVGLLGKVCSIGVIKQLENKNEKNSAGEYVPIADVRTVNLIDKVFHTESRMTTAEARNEVSNPAFWDAWLERNKGQTRDRRTIKDGEGVQSGRPTPRASGPAPVAGAPVAKKSLFGAKA